MANTAPIVDVSRLFSLSGKTAIVTGASGGLGRAMTTALASAGADIVSIELANDPGSEITAQAVSSTGRTLKQYHCDVRDPKDLRATYQKLWDDGVQGDILLNCAGIQRRADAENFTDEEIEAVLDINLKATLISCQEFAKPLLKDGRGGKIINIASIISFIGGKNITPYAASKGGVLQVTKAFSNEWASKGINVNCINPGYFHTPLTEQYMTDPKYKEFNDYVMMRTPAKRWGEPVDLAGAVIFLASSASDYVSGTSIVVDGGWLG
ncbi:2-dehydro-3-deoxy-D-gluconate 5-dehydrogenase [Fulvia fulva]|uniref:2-dehydro-3-deoxy-D-gluconate 5-dehydrogenase n=1 Tax=Passalora fulva TaxID=5499 RepID=A0A9Q8PDV4_PASFU|nr:2-dehydro-3-deoxy-D-gluconate 5-dehydrogenase [Fulvia fulva]KAK4618169.1 2-dehydro-3-deoxy-D-gluconate 5-dehydrogenase [Fulvia fulva]KAK4618466.1 2-dehydro-3-deoxy-D-gluconate 5-dehydrogenase [Fulvia fulva]UJO20630.1 2-dehydro-3-deoxy-D-gluconate 5-dehydrogenase [Fulvia fulva]WPV17925.1 2-dehydro-3-deoxy-D-gluconate 5-dehydrogenase [Fulvia fulva]WPV33007.1 2-dehydro-3-deoxy-D-gluconate 5-dehydrogenase [Fulvia fulva]